MASPDIPQLLAGAERATLRGSLILDVVDGYASDIDPSAGPVRPSGTLRFSLVERRSGPNDVQVIDPPWQLTTITNPSGYELWFGQRGDGGPPPDPGTYRVRIDSDLYAPFISDPPVQIPTSDKSIRCALQPGFTYPFGGGGLAAPLAAATLLRGALQNYDGTGQAGATVTMTAGADTADYLTDGSGQFVLVIPDPVPAIVSVDITDAGGAKTSLTNIAVTSNATTVIPQTVLTGRVVSSVLGATVQLVAPPVTVSVALDGTWRIVLPIDQKPGTVTVKATVPGQRTKPQKKITVTPGKTVPVPAFVFNP